MSELNFQEVETVAGPSAHYGAPKLAIYPSGRVQFNSTLMSLANVSTDKENVAVWAYDSENRALAFRMIGSTDESDNASVAVLGRNRKYSFKLKYLFQTIGYFLGRAITNVVVDRAVIGDVTWYVAMIPEDCFKPVLNS